MELEWILLIITLPILLVWTMIGIRALMTFSQMRDSIVYQKRYGDVSTLLSAAILFFIGIDRTLFCCYLCVHFNKELSSILVYSLYYIVSITYPITTNLIITCLFLRVWLYFYDTCWTTATFDSEWKHIIDPINYSSKQSWFVLNKANYGNYNWCKYRIRIVFIILTIVRMIAWMLEPVATHILPNIVDFLFYSISIIIIGILLKRTPKVIDFFYIRQEIQYIIGCIVSALILYFIFALVATSIHKFNRFKAEIIVLHTTTFAAFLSLLIITVWVYLKVGNLHRSKSVVGEIGPSPLPNGDDKKMRFHPHHTRFPSFKSRLSTSVAGDGQLPSLTLSRVLSDKWGLELFCRHLSNEFSIECLLSFIEMCQMQHFLSGVYQEDKLRKMPNAEAHPTTEELLSSVITPLNIGVPVAQLMQKATDSNDDMATTTIIMEAERKNDSSSSDSDDDTIQTNNAALLSNDDDDNNAVNRSEFEPHLQPTTNGKRIKPKPINVITQLQLHIHIDTTAANTVAAIAQPSPLPTDVIPNEEESESDKEDPPNPTTIKLESNAHPTAGDSTLPGAITIPKRRVFSDSDYRLPLSVKLTSNGTTTGQTKLKDGSKPGTPKTFLARKQMDLPADVPLSSIVFDEDMIANDLKQFVDEIICTQYETARSRVGSVEARTVDIELPQHADMSMISHKIRVFKIYKRYIESGSEYELNLCSSERLKWKSLMGDYHYWLTEECAHNNFCKLMTLFDKPIIEMYTLMYHAFRRFKVSSEYETLLQSMS